MSEIPSQLPDLADIDFTEPLPTEIIVSLPEEVAVILWAQAKTDDRSVEYVAAKWLIQVANDHKKVWEALRIFQERDPNPLAIDVRKERQAMTRTLRLAVLRRDNFTCVYCGAGKEKKLHVDHIVAICNGGKTVIANLQTLCFECNLGKATKPDFRQNVVDLVRK